MPIKLIQVQRKLNVGINTVVDFLRKKGFEVKDTNPNTRISDEQYALLVKEFGKDLLKKEAYKHESNAVGGGVHKKEVSSTKEEHVQEIKTEIPDELKPKIVSKGKIDLDKPYRKEAEDTAHAETVAPSEKQDETQQEETEKQDKIIKSTDSEILSVNENVTAVFMPCSTSERYYRRFAKIARYLERHGYAISGLHLIEIIRNRESKHTAAQRSSVDTANYSMSLALQGKKVVIVDDLLTTGSSLAGFARNLERIGAEVIGAVFLARTFQVPSWRKVRWMVWKRHILS